MPTFLPELGLALSALLLGAMLFFSMATAPVVFTTLEPEPAGRLIRRMFPVYYLVIIIVAALAAVCFTAADTLTAGAMAVVALGSVIARQGLMPAINRHRDAANAHTDGSVASERAFNRLHRISVWINGAQLIVVIGVVAVRVVETAL